MQEIIKGQVEFLKGSRNQHLWIWRAVGCDSWNDQYGGSHALLMQHSCTGTDGLVIVNHIADITMGYIEAKELVRLKDHHEFPVQQQKHIWHIPSR